MVRGSTTPFLDIRSIVKSGGEQGLLSMAFDPNYATNHRFYVDYTDAERRHASRSLPVRTARPAIPHTAKLLLFVKDFASNHNGGQLQFGPDGRLYWGNGDGGDEGDPKDNGQNLNRPFAKIMRLNVNKANARWQLVAYGLRNPWRFSFDRANGDLYIGDVGQDRYEEIDYLPHGFTGLANFGWKHFEGKHVYDAGTPLLTAGRYVPPVVEYPHSRRLLRLGRLRLPRQAGPVGGRAVLLRRLLLGHGLEPAGRERAGDLRPPRAVQGARPLRLRRGHGRRALSHVGQLRRPLSPRRASPCGGGAPAGPACRAPRR